MRKIATIIALLFTASIHVAGKAPTVKLIVTGGALTRPLEIVDPTVLEASSIWGGQFLDASQAGSQACPREIKPYEISFYIQSSSGSPAKRYVIYYHPQSSTQGFIYLPGRGEPWYRLNVSAILRGHRDGRWNRAAARWESLIKSWIARAEAASHER